MASEEGLKIYLRGDESGLVAATTAATKAVEKTVASAEKATKVFSTLANVVSAAADAIDDETASFRRASQAVEDLGKRHASIDELSDAIKILRKEADRADSFDILKEYNKDISLLEAEVKRLRSVGKISFQIDRANQFSLFTKDIQRTQAVLLQFAKSAKETGFQFNNLSRIQNSFSQGSMSAFQRSIKGGGSALTEFGRIIQDLPYGIQGIGNNITQFADQFQYLVQKTGSAGSALKAIGSSLLGFGGLTLGISLITSGITLLVQRYGSLSAAIDALISPMTEAAKRQKLLNDTIAQGQKDAQTELVSLDKLYRAATNANIPLSERRKIVNELQKDYPAYFKNLTDEAILTGKAADQYKRLREEIIAVATSKAIDKELEKQGGLMVDLLIKQKKFYNEMKDAEVKAEIAGDKLDRFNKSMSGIDKAFAEEEWNRLHAVFAGTSKALDIATEKFSKNQEEIQFLTKSQNELLDVQDQLIKKFGAQAAGVENSTDKTRTAADVLADLEKELSAISAQFKTFTYSIDNINEQKITALNKAFEELIRMGLKPTSPEIKKILDEIDRLNDAIIGSDLIDNKLLQQSPEAIKKHLKKGLSTGLPTIGNPSLQGIDKASTAFAAKMAKMAADAKAAFKKNFIVWGDVLSSGLTPALVNLGEVLRSGISNTLSDFGEGLGKAISGGGFTDALNAIVNSMSQFIITFGKQLVEAGVLALIAQKSIIANPYLAIAAGIGAIAIGTALKNSVPAFATGGKVTGPTLAMVGDNPSGVEYMIPKEVMDKFGGDNNGFIAETRLSGSDILVVVKRAGLNQTRING